MRGKEARMLAAAALAAGSFAAFAAFGLAVGSLGGHGCSSNLRNAFGTALFLPTPYAAYFVRRNFAPEAPDCLWVTDTTYARTWEGRLYLSFVPDTYSRRSVGWSMANNQRPSSYSMR